MAYALCLFPAGLGDGEGPSGSAMMGQGLRLLDTKDFSLVVIAPPEAQSLGRYRVEALTVSSASDVG